MPYYGCSLSFAASNEEEAQALIHKVLDLLGPASAMSSFGVRSEHAVITVYTDGGCKSPGGVGAWAFVVKRPGHPDIESFDVEASTTNNRMEMTAVLRALESIPIGQPIRVMCDSEYVIKGLTLWSRNWVRNGWKNRNGQPVVNQDLWAELLDAYKVHDKIIFEHVKGHTGEPGNERCDQLCTEAMEAWYKEYLHEHPPAPPPKVSPTGAPL